MKIKLLISSFYWVFEYHMIQLPETLQICFQFFLAQFIDRSRELYVQSTTRHSVFTRDVVDSEPITNHRSPLIFSSLHFRILPLARFNLGLQIVLHIAFQTPFFAATTRVLDPSLDFKLAKLRLLYSVDFWFFSRSLGWSVLEFTSCTHIWGSNNFGKLVFFQFRRLGVRVFHQCLLAHVTSYYWLPFFRLSLKPFTSMKVEERSIKVLKLSHIPFHNTNKTGTSKVGAISKAQKMQRFQNCKRGTLWAFWKSSLLQNIKKIEVGTLWSH